MAGLATGLRRAKTAPSLLGNDDRTPEEFEADANKAAAASYGDFGGGLASAVRGMGGSVKAYAASGLEALGKKDAANRLYKEAAQDAAVAQAVAPEIATTDQIDGLDTAARYAAGKVGGAAGSLPLGLAGGLGGRLLTKSAVGAGLGATAAYQPVMAGGHIQDLNANPNTAGMDPGEKLLRGTAVGTGQALLEGAVPGYLANRLLKRAPVAATVRGRFKDTAKEAVGGALAEGGFAAGSDVIGQGALINADPTVDFNARQTFEAGVGEAVGGVGITAPLATVNTGLDYAATRGQQAVELGKEGGDALLGKAPSGLGKVKGAVRAVGDVGALFKNTASGYLKHPELAKLVAAQEIPPELTTNGEVADWLAQDTGARRDAAIQIAQRTLIDPDASDSSRQISQALLDNPNDPDNWKPFADGLVAQQQIDRLGNTIGAARSQLAGWVDKVRGKTKANREPTEQDTEFTTATRDAFSRALNVTDEASLDDAAELVSDYVLNDFASDKEGKPRLPEGMVDALGNQAPALIETVYDTLRRQGRTSKLDATAKEKLAVVKAIAAEQLKARETGANIVEQQLTPTMMRQVTPDALADIASGLRDYVRKYDRKNTARNAAIEEQLTQLFGPNKELVLEELSKLDASLKAKTYGEAALVDAVGESVDGEDTGSDATSGADDFESPLRDIAPATNYHFEGKTGKRVFDVDDPFLVAKIERTKSNIDSSRVETQLNKNTLKPEARTEKVGVVDYAKETGDSSTIDKLTLAHPGVSLQALNDRFFVLRSQDSAPDESDAVDIKPLELARPATRDGKPNKASWQDVARIDSKKGNIDTSTIAHGRVYFTPGTPEAVNKETGEVTPATKQGKEFVTSAQKLITKMWEKKKQGAFDDRTAEKVGADDMLAMFAAGISSLQATGKFHGEMQIKMPDGKMQTLNGSDFPNDFVLYQGKNFKVTIGDARGATSKEARAKKQRAVQKDESGKEVTPKKPSEKFEVADIPSMTLTELREEYAQTRESLKKLEEKRKAIGAGPARDKLDGVRDGLLAKLEKLEAAGAKRTSDRQPTEGEIAAKETAGDAGHQITETDEMAAAAQAKEDSKPRVYQEETGLELHPKSSLEAAGKAAITPEQKAEVEAYIEKTLGPEVAKIFTGQMKGSGEWSRDPANQKATIKIATTALNPLSVAHHEAMHEFFQRLMDGGHKQATDVLQGAASSALVRRSMERTFASNKEVLKQIETDPEERVAYMFQLWAAGKLTVGPQTETVFRKIVNVIRRTLGLITTEQRAEAILQAFHDGKLSEPSAMAEFLNTEEARGAWLKTFGKKVKPVLDKSGEWVGFAENALTGSDNPHLDSIGRQLHNKTGSRGDKQGYLSAKDQMNNQYMNRFANALRGVDPAGKDKRVASKEDVELALTGLQTKEFHDDPVIRRVQDQVIAVFKDMYGYMEEAGVKRLDEKTGTWVPVKKIDDYRIPVAWDPAKIISDSKKFKELLFEHHEAELVAIADKANAEIAADKGAGKYTASWDKLENPDGKPVTAEHIADALVNRLINSNGQSEFKESENALGFSPFMKSVNERTLHWIDQTVFHEFQEKDIVKIISSYVGQATKRAEYSRRFGPDGGVLEADMKKAWEFEIAKLKEQGGKTDDIELEALKKLEPARRAIMAMEGTLGHDISMMLRKASAYTIVYQNMRLLGYALFSNLVDPLGIMVNGGEAKDAYAAFKRGISGVLKEWGELTGIRKAKDSDYDEATRVAEMIGTVDSAGFMSQMGTLYGSQYLPAWAKEMNDSFFRWNGLEAFNKAMRVQATQAGISFIKRHYEKPNEHSERYFKELGLSRESVSIDENGGLNVDNREVQQAVMRWVDGAILRPNAAIRPTMSSDPHYAIFYHLKQFMYAMHAVILKRVQIEIKNGNSDPLLLLMSGYVPVMIAADAAKGLLQVATGGGAPIWQHEGVAGVVSHGVQRAGLLGVGQMVPDALSHGPVELAGPAVGQVADAVVDPLPQTVAEATMIGPLNMALKGVSWGN